LIYAKLVLDVAAYPEFYPELVGLILHILDELAAIFRREKLFVDGE